MAFNNRRLLSVLSALAVGFTLAAPAHAQLPGGRAAFDQGPRAEPAQFREFFRAPLWGGGGGGGGDGSMIRTIRFIRGRSSQRSPAAAAAAQGRNAADRYGDRHRRFTCRLARLRSRGNVRRHAGGRRRAQDPAVSRSRARRCAARLAGMVASDQGCAGDGKARRHRCHARHQRPLAAAREQLAASAARAGQGQGQGQGQAATSPAPASGDTPPPDSEQPPIAKTEAPRRPPGGIYEFTPTDGPSLIQSASTT